MQNEFGYARLDIFRNARKDRFGVAHDENLRGIASRAFGVSLHCPANAGRALAAKVKREARTIMIFVDRSARFAGGGLDRAHDASGFGRRIAAGLPAGAMRAVRRMAASLQPPIHIGISACTGFGAMVTPFSL